jgi:hypothetical protein
MSTKGRKGSDSYEDDFVESDDKENRTPKNAGKKAKTEAKAKKSPGRQASRPIYKFTRGDLILLETAVQKYGTSYASIAKEYFADTEPKVTRKDVQNIVQSTPHLKKFCLTGMLLQSVSSYCRDTLIPFRVFLALFVWLLVMFLLLTL